MLTADLQRTPRWFRAALSCHRWTGLVVAPFFLVLCLTGTLLIFHDEIDAALGDTAAIGPAPSQTFSLDKLAAAAMLLAPGESVRSISFVEDAPDRAFVGVAPSIPSKLALW